MRLSRFVALGDSFTEGLDDLRADGTPRGWADLVADVLAVTQPDFHYANLAVRGLRIDQIVPAQVDLAISMQPDLATIAGGGNDILGLRVDLDGVAARLDSAVAALRATGAKTLVFTGFDPRAQLPGGRFLARRTAAFNRNLVMSASRHGATVINLWSMSELLDPRLWGADRLHMSTAGHQHVAAVVLGRLGQPVPVGWRWIPEAWPRHRWRAARASELAWGRQHLTPWLGRKVRGRSTGDGRSPKHPVPVRWPVPD